MNLGWKTESKLDDLWFIAIVANPFSASGLTKTFLIITKFFIIRTPTTSIYYNYRWVFLFYFLVGKYPFFEICDFFQSNQYQTSQDLGG